MTSSPPDSLELGLSPELHDELLRSGATVVEELVESGGSGLRITPSSVAALGRTLSILRTRALPVRVSGTSDGPLPPPAGGAIVDLVKLDRIVNVDPRTCTARVEAGCAVAALETAALRAGCTLGPMLPSVRGGSVGAWLGGPTRGMRGVPGSRHETVALALTSVLPDGRIAESRPAPRSSMGPDLDFLSLGGAGRLSVIAAAWMRLLPLGDVEVASFKATSLERAIAAFEQLSLDRLAPVRARALVTPEGVRLAATWETPQTARLERIRAVRRLADAGLTLEPATQDAAAWVRSPSGPDAIEVDARWPGLREFARTEAAQQPGAEVRVIGPWAGGSFAVVTAPGADADKTAALARQSSMRVISPRRLRDAGAGWPEMGAQSAWKRLVKALGAEERGRE
ncbi:MAG: FAD-binding oxidoreductase [Deltaproteobacteria bacterium]|nr:FAD-binding oxidoreductase [Deltaproteobacteria bacterium]